MTGDDQSGTQRYREWTRKKTGRTGEAVEKHRAKIAGSAGILAGGGGLAMLMPMLVSLGVVTPPPDPHVETLRAALSECHRMWSERHDEDGEHMDELQERIARCWQLRREECTP